MVTVAELITSLYSKSWQARTLAKLAKAGIAATKKVTTTVFLSMACILPKIKDLLDNEYSENHIADCLTNVSSSIRGEGSRDEGLLESPNQDNWNQAQKSDKDVSESTGQLVSVRQQNCVPVEQPVEQSETYLELRANQDAQFSIPTDRELEGVVQGIWQCFNRQHDAVIRQHDAVIRQHDAVIRQHDAIGRAIEGLNRFSEGLQGGFEAISRRLGEDSGGTEISPTKKLPDGEGVARPQRRIEQV